MIVSTTRSAMTVLPAAGLTLVSAVNNPFPAGAAVPFRMTGDVVQLQATFDKPWKSGFHIYGGVSQVGSFQTSDACREAVQVAERQLRLNPGPGIIWPTQIGEAKQRGMVLAENMIAVGHVFSHWDTESRSVINETDIDHVLYNGFIARQVAQVDRSIFVSTYGEGVNEKMVGGGAVSAWANGTFGPGIFKPLDMTVSRQLSSLDGFLKTPLSRPPGSDLAYWGFFDQAQVAVMVL